jgi:hypothetical protein
MGKVRWLLRSSVDREIGEWSTARPLGFGWQARKDWGDGCLPKPRMERSETQV